jgi:hypothetical protein
VRNNWEAFSESKHFRVSSVSQRQHDGEPFDAPNGIYDDLRSLNFDINHKYLDGLTRDLAAFHETHEVESPSSNGRRDLTRTWYFKSICVGNFTL